MGRAVILAIGKKKKKYLECRCQKYTSLPSSQLSSFPSIVLTVLENDAVQRETQDAVEYQPSKEII